MTAKRVPYQGTVLAAKASERAARADVRNRVCTQQRGFEGKPEDYVYVEYCRQKASSSGTVKSASAKPAKLSYAREIKALEKAIADFPKGHRDSALDSDQFQSCVILFKYMINPEAMKKFPNPNKRYNHWVGEAIRLMSANARQSEFAPSSFPKFFVFTLVLEHFKGLT